MGNKALSLPPRRPFPIPPEESLWVDRLASMRVWALRWLPVEWPNSTLKPGWTATVERWAQRADAAAATHPAATLGVGRQVLAGPYVSTSRVRAAPAAALATRRLSQSQTPVT
jgi:hypothetical protein